VSAFNARKRYLTGLGLSPSQAYRKRRLLARLGDDDSDFPSLGPTSIADNDPTIDYGVIDPTVQMAITGAGGSALGPAPAVGTLPTFISPSTVASIANLFKPASSSTPASSASWTSAVNPTFGVSNGVLLMGVGGIALRVMLSGGRRR
jgi:hypothetical protein